MDVFTSWCDCARGTCASAPTDHVPSLTRGEATRMVFEVDPLNISHPTSSRTLFGWEPAAPLHIQLLNPENIAEYKLGLLKYTTVATSTLKTIRQARLRHQRR